MANPFPPPPGRLVEDDGTVHFGNFGGSPAELGLESVLYRRLRRPPWSWADWTARRLLKRWQFVGAIDGDLVVGAAVAHVQYLATCFAYVYDRRTGELFERSLKAPLALGAEFSQAPDRGMTSLALGERSVVMDNTIRRGGRGLAVHLGDLEIHLHYREDGVGMSTACPQVDGGLHYTYKFAGLPVTGRVRIGDRQVELSEDALALLDWTASTPPRATTWNWSCAVGSDSKGRRVAINFSRGLVGGGYSQNGVWLDGRPTLLPDVDFRYESDRITEAPWLLRAPDGLVNLTFRPAGERYEDINLGLVASRLHQPFGEFTGRVKAGDEDLDVKLFGFCEEHYAKW